MKHKYTKTVAIFAVLALGLGLFPFVARAAGPPAAPAANQVESTAPAANQAEGEAYMYIIGQANTTTPAAQLELPGALPYDTSLETEATDAALALPGAIPPELPTESAQGEAAAEATEVTETSSQKTPGAPQNTEEIAPDRVEAAPQAEGETAEMAAEGVETLLYPNAPDTYSIQYDLGGGQYRSETSMKAVDNHLYHAGENAQLRAADAVLEGGELSGWSLAGKAYAFGESYAIQPRDAGADNVITFTAQYRQEPGPLTLLYKLVDGDRVLATYSQSAQTSADTLHTALPRTAFVNSGYLVDLWTYDPAQVSAIEGATANGLKPGGTFYALGDTAVFTSDVALHQTDLQVWPVSFVAAEGGSLEGETGPFDIKYGTLWEAPHFRLPKPVPQPGYTFSGWTVNVNYLSPNPAQNTDEPITSPVVYTAHFRSEAAVLSPLELNALPGGKTYGEKEPALKAELAGEELAPGDREAILAAVILGRKEGESAGSYPIQLRNELELEALFPGYDIRYTPALFTIAPASLPQPPEAPPETPAPPPVEGPLTDAETEEAPPVETPGAATEEEQAPLGPVLPEDDSTLPPAPLPEDNSALPPTPLPESSTTLQPPPPSGDEPSFLGGTEPAGLSAGTAGREALATANALPTPPQEATPGAQPETTRQSTTLTEEEVPLASALAGEDGWSLLGLLASALAFALSLLYSARLLKKHSPQQAKSRRFLLGLVPVILGILAPTWFLYSQNLGGPMALANGAALPCLVLLALQLTALLLMRKKSAPATAPR